MFLNYLEDCSESELLELLVHSTDELLELLNQKRAAISKEYFLKKAEVLQIQFMIEKKRSKTVYGSHLN